MLLFFVPLAAARDIVFPPAIGISCQDALLSKTPGLPGTTNAFAGLTTFANLPYVHCLADVENEDVEKFDIAFLGAPFDTVSCNSGSTGLWADRCSREQQLDQELDLDPEAFGEAHAGWSRHLQQVFTLVSLSTRTPSAKSGWV